MRNVLLALGLIFGTFVTIASAEEWSIPDVDKLPMDAFGRTVRAGRDLIVHTAATIGPDAADPAMRYSGNGLECQSCHLDAGNKKFGLPLAGVWGLFPQFIGRENEVRTLEERINGCMERSMNGRALPRDSHEMKALLAYLTFLGSQQPAGEAPVGRGAPALPLPTRAASPQRGAAVFQNNCAACHQSNGLGLILQSGDQLFEKRRYVYPPLWGPESYNDAAGMARVITGAWFVHANMPKGITFEYPLLSADDAYDVMAFVDTQPRPHKADLSKDYPDLWLKPIGTPYPPWVGHFSAAQNRYGPWQPILDWRRKNLPPPEAKSVPAANDLEQSVYAAGNR